MCLTRHIKGVCVNILRSSMVAAAAFLAAGLSLSACSVPEEGDPGRLVLAEPASVDELNPVDGYSAAGVSPIYEGLLRPAADGDDSLPELEPRLAESEPEVSPDGRTWTVHLREGVRFHDGTELDASDVAATYEAVSDPDVASSIAADFALIDHIDTPDDATVVFHLAYPFRGFSQQLLLGIAPSERIEVGPASTWALTTEPVGTGPYKSEHVSSTETTLVANEDYWGDAPSGVRRMVLRSVEDDTARAQQFRSGEVDGTVLPPRMASEVEGAEFVRSADWRGLSLPMNNPFTSDRAARLAMNMAVDREAIIDTVLGGHGRVGTQMLSPEYPEYSEVSFNAETPGAANLAQAAATLEDAGWSKGADGVYERDGDRASFPLVYPASDSLRRELASAFVDQMQDFGIEVELQGMSWDDIESRLGEVAILLGGGDTPYTADSQMYRSLHTRGEDAGAVDNPGLYSNPRLDEALEAARREGDETKRAERYAEAQSVYEDDPAYVVLAFVDHAYVTRDRGMVGPKPIFEPHAHGVTWGPWWDVAEWTTE